MFQAFRVAVSLILERLAPPGELIPPEPATQFGAKIGVPPDQLKSMMPEGFGFIVSEIVWRVLTTMKNRTGNERSFRFLAVCHAAGSRSPWRRIRRT